MKQKPRRSKQPSWLWLQGAAAGGLAAVFPGTALLAAVLLFPALVFYGTEATRGHPVGRTMLLTGSAAVVFPLRTLWSEGNSIAMALDILSDPFSPLLGWAGCAAGWLLCEVALITAQFASTTAAKRKAASLTWEAAELRAEWSLSDAPTDTIP